MPRVLLLLLALSILVVPALAQDAEEMPPGDSSVAVQVMEGPVEVPEPTAKAVRYYRSGVWIWWFNLFWGLAVPGLILFSGFSARMRSLVRGKISNWWVVVTGYMVLYMVLTYIINLPIAYYLGYARQHAYGLSNQTLGKWFGDSFKGMFITLIAVVLFAWIPWLIIKKSPRRWWLYSGLSAVPFLFFIVLVTPIWVSPLFNDFGPMKDQALEAQILGLAERSGIEDSRVFEVDKSVDTKAVSAYVTGFLDTKRIVLWDTIIEKLETDELLFVMGHEMGHYVLKHVLSTILFLSLLLMAALYAIHRTAGSLIERYRSRFGFKEISDVAALPLLLLLFQMYFFVLTPAFMAWSRHNEHEADRFGLELTQSNRAAALAFVKLQKENLGIPRPGLLFKIWRASHPPLGERIDFCNEYRPWESEEALRYADQFSP